MIKSLPGWLNYIILVIAYGIIGQLLALWIKDPFILAFTLCAFYAGGYLAKWTTVITLDKSGNVIKIERKFW